MNTNLAHQHYNPGASAAAHARRSTLLLLLIASALIAVRLPSLVQPMGADQALYAYVGERILQGERPYVDAWDQKPPAIHYTYALLRAIWPGDGVVAAADLTVTALIALLLFLIGRELASPPIGATAALLFLLLSNPAFGRLAGVRVRAQCETFIGLAVAAGVYLLIRQASAWRRTRAQHTRRPPTSSGDDGSALRSVAACAGAGLLFGVAVTFKYNAAAYAVGALACLIVSGAVTRRGAAAFLAGCAAPSLAFLAMFADALRPVYDATIAYNVRYSGETYSGPWDFLGYLLTFPVAHARVDALWTLGGAGCAVLLAAAAREPRRLIPVAWVAAACLSVAINGSRGLPQYFVQAAPGLALAAAWAGWILAAGTRRAWPGRRGHTLVAAAMVVIAVAAWRVNQVPKLIEQTWFDAQHMAGRMPREAYLARYVDGQKYTALGATQVAETMRTHAAAGETVYLFGFTAAAYVHADRASASRFFWSRPVIAGFNEGVAGYGVTGLLADLERARPAVVALQVHDWAPDVDNSAHFFLSTPPLAEWLRAAYRAAPGPDGFDVWIRRD